MFVACQAMVVVCIILLIPAISMREIGEAVEEYQRRIINKEAAENYFVMGDKSNKGNILRNQHHLHGKQEEDETFKETFGHPDERTPIKGTKTLNTYKRGIIDKEAAENYYVMGDTENEQNEHNSLNEARTSLIKISVQAPAYGLTSLTLFWILFGILTGQVIRTVLNKHHPQPQFCPIPPTPCKCLGNHINHV
eukprot:TRINITY_DN74233_c0_g1_i1.p1 TRINITY_DN74233_c0_g1~~TRINITY_DN74233_c0_g1_i1.p1  ORF type:complete len:194 (+),score=30.67 TRINITY_DN74233_c0_g1_i1:36-617(+)